MDQTAALNLADSYLKTRSLDWDAPPVRLIRESSFIDGKFLIVQFNSIAFLDRGEIGEMLGGNMPIRVDLNSGNCELIKMVDLIDYMDRGLIS
ncbi:hypothetical protein [Kitasatospora indigofera]|uniref:hypothetical protein n=1 Tax=Kitasatospora indigofera TaxID=67307 RepID=UPI0036C9E144